MPEVRRHSSSPRSRGVKPSRAVNSCAAISVLPDSSRARGHGVAELGQQLDVQGRVPELRRGERAYGPVGGAVPLLEHLAELALHEGTEADALTAEEPTGELGVEEGLGSQAQLGEAREVLGGGVQDPLDTLGRPLDGGEVRDGDRVDQGRAGPLPAHLHQVGALAVR